MKSDCIDILIGPLRISSVAIQFNDRRILVKKENYDFWACLILSIYINLVEEQKYYDCLRLMLLLRLCRV